MSTRAVYTFIEGKERYHVYKHHDGYPKGAAQGITAALSYSWGLPRFEADEFASSFVAANKISSYQNDKRELFEKAYLQGLDDKEKRRLEMAIEYDTYCFRGGGVRLLRSGSVYTVAPRDIKYRYEISGGGNDLYIVAYDVRDIKQGEDGETKIFEGSLTNFVKTYGQKEGAV
jgi:hypothetical protein